MDLQELISRGRFIFTGVSERLKVFALVDGRKTAKEIADRIKGWHVSNLHRDLRKLRDLGLIQERTKGGEIQKKDGFASPPAPQGFAPATTRTKNNSSTDQVQSTKRGHF